MTPADLRLLYTLAIGSLGAIVPFLAVELQDAGLTATEVGLVLLTFPAGRLLSAPLAAWVADRFRVSGALLASAWGVAGLAAAALPFVRSPAAVLALVAVFTLAMSTFGPILDGMAFTLLGDQRSRYGRYRLWGSVGFGVAVVLAGILRDATPIPPVLLGSAMLLVLAVRASFLRDLRAEPPPPILPALGRVLRTPGLAALLLASSLHVMALSGYDLLFSAHVEALGLPARITSEAMALGVLLEIGALWAGPALLARVDPGRLMVVAIACGVLRWGLTAVVTTPAAVVAVQGFHGVTFGLYWLAGAALLASRSPAGVAASAQGLLYLSGWGVGALVGLPLATLVLDHSGSQAMFLLFAGEAAVGTLVAAPTLRRPHP